ncbi:MAG: hypothetical protein ABIX01_22380 [Chitinophagaceae bacterium]
MKEACQLMVEEGITKFKCATIAEAEMLGMIAAPDVLLAYQPVGPNLARFVALITASNTASRHLGSSLLAKNLLFQLLICVWHRVKPLMGNIPRFLGSLTRHWASRQRFVTQCQSSFGLR